MGKKIYGRAGQATDSNVAHALCMPDTKRYKHTHRICNTSLAQQKWLRERASVLTLYVHCVS